MSKGYFPPYYDPGNSNIPVAPPSTVYSGQYLDQAGNYWQTNDITTNNFAKPPDLYRNYVQPQDTYTTYNYLPNSYSMGYQSLNWPSLVQHPNPIDPATVTDKTASEPHINYPYNLANQSCCSVPGCDYTTNPYIDYTMANYTATIQNNKNTKYPREGSDDSNSNTDIEHKTKTITYKEQKMQIACPSRSILDKIYKEKQKDKKELEENMRRYFSDLWECNSEKINNACIPKDTTSNTSKPSSDKILNRYRDYERFMRKRSKRTDTTTHQTVIKNRLSYKKANKFKIVSPNNQSLNNNDEKDLENKDTLCRNKYQESKEKHKIIKKNNYVRKSKQMQERTSECKDTTAVNNNYAKDNIEEPEPKNTIKQRENLVTDTEYKQKNKQTRNVLNTTKRKSNTNRDTDFNNYCSDDSSDNVKPEKKRLKADIDRDKIKKALAKIAAKTKQKKKRLEAESEPKTRKHKPENILVNKTNMKPNKVDTNQTKKIYNEKAAFTKKYCEMINKPKSVVNRSDTNISKIHKNKNLTHNETEVKNGDQYCDVLKKLQKCCSKIQLNKQKHKLINSKLSKNNTTSSMAKMKPEHQNHTQSLTEKDVILPYRNENNNIPIKNTIEADEISNSLIDDTEKISSDSFGDMLPIIETGDSSTPNLNINRSNSHFFDKKKCEDTNNDLINHNTENEVKKRKRLMSPICKPKAKKRKTIKLVINIECHSSESSEVDENIEHRTSTPTYDDTTFLDDFNVDEIVNSLDGHVKDIDNKKASIDVPLDNNKGYETKQEPIKSNSMFPDFKNENKNEMSVESCAAIYKYLLDSYNNRPHLDSTQMNITDSIKNDPSCDKYNMAKEVIADVSTENYLPNVVNKTDSNVIVISDDDDECAILESTSPQCNGSLITNEGKNNNLAHKIGESTRLSPGCKNEGKSEYKEETCAEIFKFIVESYDDKIKKQNEVCQNDIKVNPSGTLVPIKKQEETLIENYSNPSPVLKDTRPKNINISSGETRNLDENLILDTYCENSDRVCNIVLLNDNSCEVTNTSTDITSNAETNKVEFLGAHSAHPRNKRNLRLNTAPPVETLVKNTMTLVTKTKSPCQTQMDSYRTEEVLVLDKKMEKTKKFNTHNEEHGKKTHTSYTKNTQLKNLHTNNKSNSLSKNTKLEKYQSKLDGVNKLDKNTQHETKQKIFKTVNIPKNKPEIENQSSKLDGNRDSNTKFLDNIIEQKKKLKKSTPISNTSEKQDLKKQKAITENCQETRTSYNKNNLSKLKEVKEKEHSNFELSTSFDHKLMSKENKNINIMNSSIPKINSKNIMSGSFICHTPVKSLYCENDKTNEISLKPKEDKPEEREKTKTTISYSPLSTRNKITQKIIFKTDTAVEKKNMHCVKTSTKLNNIPLKDTKSNTTDKRKIKSIGQTNLDSTKKIEEPFIASSSSSNKKLNDHANASNDLRTKSKDKTQLMETKQIPKVIKESNPEKLTKITHNINAPKSTFEAIKSKNPKSLSENQSEQIATNVDNKKPANKKTSSAAYLDKQVCNSSQNSCQNRESTHTDITKSVKTENKSNLKQKITDNKEINSEEQVASASEAFENLNKNENINNPKTLTMNINLETTAIRLLSEKCNKATLNTSIENKVSKNKIFDAVDNVNNSIISSKQEVKRIEPKPASQICTLTTGNINSYTENNVLNIKMETFVNNALIFDKQESTTVEHKLPTCSSTTDSKVLTAIVVENNIDDFNLSVKTENVKETVTLLNSDTKSCKSDITAADADLNNANTTLPIITQLNSENANSPVDNKNTGNAATAKDSQTVADNNNSTNNITAKAQPENEESNKIADDDKTTEPSNSNSPSNKSNNVKQNSTTNYTNEAQINTESDIKIPKSILCSNAGQKNSNISITTNNATQNAKTTTTQSENDKAMVITNKNIHKEESTVDENINQTTIKPKVNKTAPETDVTKVLHKNKQAIRSEVKFDSGKNISDNPDTGEKRKIDIKEDLFFSDLKMKLVRMEQKFSIISQLHMGYYSTIYKCKDKHNQNYVVKICPKSRQHHNKAKLLLKLQRTIIDNDICIRRIVESFYFQGRWCVLMDYYPSTLRCVLDERRCGFHIDVVQSLSRQLVTAVAELTTHGIIHSDINPSHILLNNNHTMLKLCGFDRSNYANSLKILPCTSSISYRAPEAVLGFNADYRIDVWATALVMYEMVTAKTLFVARNNNQLLFKQMSTVGCVSPELVNMSEFGYLYFSGTSFIQKFSFKPFVKLIHTIYMNSTLRTSIFNSYERDWEFRRNRWQVTQDLDKLEIFYDLLQKMLVPDPRYRLPITFVVANEFIHDMFTE